MGYTPPYLDVSWAPTYTKIYGIGTTSGDDLIIYANKINTLPAIELTGNSSALIYPASTGSLQVVFPAAASTLKISNTGNDLILENTTANKNLSLITNGTGLVKFGTRTAGGDTVSNGYITILDAAGNTVKLMTTA
jgi:hypothetical protein